MAKLIVIGHSHIGALHGASRARPPGAEPELDFLFLRDPELRRTVPSDKPEPARVTPATPFDSVDRTQVAARIVAIAPDAALLCLHGNQHSVVGLFKRPGRELENREAGMAAAVLTPLQSWLDFLRPLLPARVVMLPPPPPVGATGLAGNFPAERIAPFEGLELESIDVRRRSWCRQRDLTREFCSRHGIGFIEVPAEVFDAAGMLDRAYWGADPMHANQAYGQRVLDRVFAALSAPAASGGTPAPAGAYPVTVGGASARPPGTTHTAGGTSAQTMRSRQMPKKILVIGHSHTIALHPVPSEADRDEACAFDFLLLRNAEFRADPPTGELSETALKQRTSDVVGIDQEAVRRHIQAARADAALVCISGNEQSGLALFQTPGFTTEHKFRHLAAALDARIPPWLDFLLPLLPRDTLFFPPPPPVPLPALDGHFPPQRLVNYEGLALEPCASRLRVWNEYCRLLAAHCARRGARFARPPAEVFDEQGLLAQRFWGDDPMHGNRQYGSVMRHHLLTVIEGRGASAAHAAQAAHPYTKLPDSAFWKQSISMRPGGEVDPVLEPPFRISRKDRVATAGSCFAQHISKRLRLAGFRYMQAESVPEDKAAGERRGFYDFSARYGNVYTARQLLQLFDRAFGYFRPLDRVWARQGGGFCDPFRPRIEPDGFASEAAVEADQRNHLLAVRRMFRQLDVLVFTLGLTECWTARLDGAAYPVAPGVVGGVYDPSRHAFSNFSVAEVVADLDAFIGKLRLVNPAARLILTVSPVPLVATAAQRHVLVSTTYSKAVLRVAAEEVSRAHDRVCYFPSYEIITGPHAEGRYFEADRRSVTASGVDHVMRVFMARMTAEPEVVSTAPGEPGVASAAGSATIARIDALMEAACDEEVLER